MHFIAAESRRFLAFSMLLTLWCHNDNRATLTRLLDYLPTSGEIFKFGTPEKKKEKVTKMLCAFYWHVKFAFLLFLNTSNIFN